MVQVFFEAMPDFFARQGEPAGHRPRVLSLWGDGSWWAPVRFGPKAACHRLVLLLVWLASALWAGPLLAQRSDASKPDVHRFDIGIIIDNRPLPRSDAAKADVDGLVRMLDRQMFIEHVMVFERPTIEVICDLFGCPEVIEDINPFPSLIWQITREKEARLFVYYIGDGRIEGLERQLLFRRGDNDDGRIEALSVDWLHAMLEDARPASAVLMLDTSFSPRSLPCADEDPRLIDDALTSVRSAYRNVMRERWNRADVLELSATTSVQPPHCDRFDQVLDDREQPLFTKFLLKAIVEGLADEEPFGDEDRLIELGELEAYLDDRIKRAARFQWGRSQNVRAVGPRSKVLATLDGRKLSDGNRDVVARRNRSPEEGETEEPAIAELADSPEPGGSDQALAGGGRSEIGSTKAAAVRTVRTSTCRDDPSAPGCHPCVIDPSGLACAERCQGDGGADLCAPNLSTTTEGDSALKIGGAGKGAKEAEVTAAGGETDQPVEDETGERSSACAWVAGNVAPYAVSLVQRIRGGTDTSCGWAVDRSDVELGPFAKIFTPIGWRLARGSAQDAVSCLLDCGSTSSAAAAEGSPVVMEDDAAPAGKDAIAVQEGAPPDQPETIQLTSTRRVPQTPVDPRTLGAFNREICDQLEEPLPPYIGLPRWMPGTLIISEALRAGYGCAPPPAAAVLPTPFAVALEAPAEVKTPAPDKAPAVASADRRLSRWPSSSAGLGPSVNPSANEFDEQPDDADLGARIADSTRASSDGPMEEQKDPPEETLQDEKKFDRTVSKVRWLQSALTVDNRHPGPIDGIIGAKTEAAIRSWRRDHERESRTGPLTEPEFREIIRDFGQRFGQIEERAQSF